MDASVAWRAFFRTAGVYWLTCATKTEVWEWVEVFMVGMVSCGSDGYAVGEQNQVGLTVCCRNGHWDCVLGNDGSGGDDGGVLSLKLGCGGVSVCKADKERRRGFCRLQGVLVLQVFLCAVHPSSLFCLGRSQGGQVRESGSGEVNQGVDLGLGFSSGGGRHGRVG